MKQSDFKLLIIMTVNGIIIGTCIYSVLGIIGYIFAHVSIDNNFKDKVKKRENKKLAVVVAIMTTFCMWLHWVCAYMH